MENQCNMALIESFKGNIEIKNSQITKLSSFSVKNSKYNKNYYKKKGVTIQCDRNFGHIGLIFSLMKYVYAIPCHFVIAK